MLICSRFSRLLTRSSHNFKRSLHHQIYDTSVNGSIIYGFRNNLISQQGKAEYANQSWQHIRSNLLKRNALYIYLDKAKLNKGRLYPGHVVSFITDENGIVEESCISLRNGAKVDGKVLLYQVTDKIARKGFVHKVRFLELKDEFNNYLFDRAVPDKDVSIDDERYLLGLPLKPSEISTLVERVRLVKSLYSSQEYILHSGTVNDVEVDALNCVTGFYRGAGVVGTEPDPSPQMSVWSYLAYIWNVEERDKFLEKTNVREPGLERVHDDHLRPWHHNTPSPPRSGGYKSSSNTRQYTTMPQKQSWESIWQSMSESDKLQSAIATDEPENAEVAYYKGLAFKDFGPKYSGHAMAAFRQALSFCGPKDATIKERCESELRIIEAQNKTQVIPSEQLTQIHNEIDHLKDLILAVKKSVDQLVRKVDGV
jgi:hypothetical protein